MAPRNRPVNTVRQAEEDTAWWHRSVRTAEQQRPGQEIRRVRKERGLTQKRLARLAKVNRSQLAEIESGRVKQPQQDTLDRLWGALLAVRPRADKSAPG